MIVKVVPQLRFGQEDELTVMESLLAAPQVGKAAEGQSLVAEGGAPHARQLERMVGAGVGIAAEEALVHQLDAVGGREIVVVTVPGATQQGRLLEAASALAQTAVVLHMGGKAFLSYAELAAHLGIGRLGELAAEIDIDEVEPTAPLVGGEFLVGQRHLGSSGLVVGIEVPTEVVMQL